MTATASPSQKMAFGLRERLLLSFATISLLSVIAAVVGNYAFYALAGGDEFDTKPIEFGRLLATRRWLLQQIASYAITSSARAVGSAADAHTASSPFLGASLSVTILTHRDYILAVLGASARSDSGRLNLTPRTHVSLPHNQTTMGGERCLLQLKPLAQPVSSRARTISVDDATLPRSPHDQLSV